MPASLPSYAPFIRLSRDLQIEILLQIIESSKTPEEAINSIQLYMRCFYDPQVGKTQLYRCQIATNRAINALADKYYPPESQHLLETAHLLKTQEALLAKCIGRESETPLVTDRETDAKIRARELVKSRGLVAMNLGSREAANWFAQLVPEDRQNLLTWLGRGDDGMKRRLQEIKFLLKVGLDARSMNKELLADNIRDLSVLQFLKKKGAALYPELLHHAALTGVVDVLQWLISNLDNRDVNIMFRSATPLMRAAGAGHDEAVQLLINAGADLNARDTEYGSSAYTAVISAVLGNYLSTVKLLVENGADPNPVWTGESLLEAMLGGLWPGFKFDLEPFIEYIKQAEIGSNRS